MHSIVVEPTLDSADLAALNSKIDRLTEQVAFLAEEAQRQRTARIEWQELRADLTPIGMEMYQVAVDQLSELEPHVQFEDFLHLFKRLLRNTRTLEQMLDQLESVVELGSDLLPLSQDAIFSMMARLDEMERKGYFRFMAGGLDIVDRIVTNFSDEDVQQLGENIVLILQTVKEMTQPEIMLLLRNTASVVRSEEPTETPSLFAIARQLNDPSVRRGLDRTLSVLKTLG